MPSHTPCNEYPRDYFPGVLNGANPFTNQKATWFLGSMRYTVQVKDPDAKPAGPTEADAKRFRNYVNSTSSSKGAVYIWCEANLNDHGAWFDYLTQVPKAIPSAKS